MKPITYVAIPLLALATAAFAMSARNAALDVNGDGVLTLDEVQAAYPDITTEGFSAMDTDADGTLSDTEITAAEDSGSLPTGS